MLKNEGEEIFIEERLNQSFVYAWLIKADLKWGIPTYFAKKMQEEYDFLKRKIATAESLLRKGENDVLLQVLQERHYS